MPEEYVTERALEARLAEADVANAAGGYATHAETSEAIKGAIEGYEKEKKKEEGEFKWFSEWKNWVPTEFNAIKSEITALKAEFVPFNATLPSFFSLEELVKNKLDLEYGDSGFLRRRALQPGTDDPTAPGGTGEPASGAAPPPALPAPPTNDPSPQGSTQQGTPAPTRGSSEPAARGTGSRSSGPRSTGSRNTGSRGTGGRTPGPTTAQLRQQEDQARRTGDAMSRVTAAARPAADGVRRLTADVNDLDRNLG
ncbi:hypothetical protein [Streptomyces sp. NPDC056730]|uniref:hypothetical protein n=1 Tax=unclassified Streptomyces TaxID=2593676 RepID=UPI00368F2878